MRMKLFRNILYQSCFALNCLLMFLLLLENRIAVPAVLQVVGRMHPLILHFPIVLLLLAIFWEIVLRHRVKQADDIGDGLLLVTAFTAVLASLMGLFLSREEGYDAGLLNWHKWGGVAISLLTLLWYQYRNTLRNNNAGAAVAITALALVVITGHQGANLTHGAGFLSEPLMAAYAPEPVLMEDAVVFTHMVQPILEQKCVGCHNQRKRKGGLLMTSYEELLKGGKSGKLWDSADAGYGLLLQRVHLPLAAKKHMPPQGKPQLDESEMAIIANWIKCGASPTVRVADLPETDTLRVLASQRFQTSEADNYAFVAADGGTIEKLNNNYRLVQPLSVRSPALAVSFFSPAQFHSDQLRELLPVKERVVGLNLKGMPVSDADLEVVAQFRNLRKLQLSFTRITDAGLPRLAGLKELKHLSLSGTRTGGGVADLLARLPKLVQIELWQTGLSNQQVKLWQAANERLRIVDGYRGDTVQIKLNPPLIDHDESVISEPTPLRLKHFIEGVAIRYTTDGSEPDSINSPLFSGKQVIDRNMTLKTRAFKPGWISSATAEKQFFRSGIPPDSIKLQTKPDPQYPGGGGATLIDAKKGDLNFRSGMWLGYRNQPLEAWLYFNTKRQVQSVAISCLVDVNGYILPPETIEVWGDEGYGKWTLLTRKEPVQPKEPSGGKLAGTELSFAPTQVKRLKVIAKPLPVLPSWHPGKGQRAWIFVDEVFVN